MFQLDVVICTYNNASLLDRTLDFLGKQQVVPGVEWGVLIVDNNCTDSTSDVIENTSDLAGFRVFPWLSSQGKD